MQAVSRQNLLRHVLGALGVLALVIFGAGLRVDTALADSNFDAVRPEGMLKSDPGLLYYITERILEAGGGTPEDFRADPRVQHPDPTDIPGEFTVGQEFLVAWARGISGSEEPLHVFAQRVMSWCAAAFVLGLYLLVVARTRSVVWGLAASLFAFCVAANYRTIGYILVREDLALPLFALGLGLLARAVRRENARAFFVSGLAFACALATWHAMSFLVTIALTCSAFVLFTERKSVFELAGGPWLLLGPALAGLFVPALRTSGLLLSPGASLALGLVGAAWLVRWRPLGRGARLGVTFGLGLAHALLAAFVVDAGSYAHVHQVLLAKLAHGGALPPDPQAISFDARLLWQGPFETLPFDHIVAWLGVPTLLVGVAAIAAAVLRRRELEGFERWLLLFAVVTLPLAWLFGRLIVLPAMALPMAFACFAARAPRAPVWLGGFLLAAGLQAFATSSSLVPFLQNHTQNWYQPPGRQLEIAQLVEWVGENLSPEVPIAADFMNSTAILAHAGNPICLQPKYETDRSRRAAEAFLGTFFHGTPDEFRELLRERFGVRHVLIDRYTLGVLSKYTAGLHRRQAPAPGTAAEVFLSQDEARLRGLEGFELLYRSPPTILQSNGDPYDFYRLYALED